MVPKLFAAGNSFKGVARYLTHDPDKALTAERVAWTRTVNLAHDDVPSAVNEMLWTYRAADMLKRQAGVAAGGRRLDSPAKHFSLNWHPSEHPTKEHMVEAVQSFLEHMGWDQHQAILVAHNDKQPHVHVLVNAVHPETGRALNTSFEKRRAQDWALQYEREHDLIFCEERLKPKEERTASPTRAAWETLREAERQFDQAEADRTVRAPDYFERGDRTRWQAKEWEALRGHQKDQRTDFFADGKQEFRDARNEVYRQVREEFRPAWRAFYKARRDGLNADVLAEWKTKILDAQKSELETRRDAACGALREERDVEYKGILIDQKQQRADLTGRQAQGLHSPHLLDDIYAAPAVDRDARHPGGPVPRDAADQFAGAADETCAPTSEKASEFRDHEKSSFENDPAPENHRVRDGLDAAGMIGLGALGAIANIGERLFDGFFGGGEQPRKEPKPAGPPPPNPSATEEKKARAAEKQPRAEQAIAAEAAQLEAYWRERKRSRVRDRD